MISFLIFWRRSIVVAVDDSDCSYLVSILLICWARVGWLSVGVVVTAVPAAGNSREGDGGDNGDDGVAGVASVDGVEELGDVIRVEVDDNVLGLEFFVSSTCVFVFVLVSMAFVSVGLDISISPCALVGVDFLPEVG